MRTGVSYMGQHDLPYLKLDFAEMRDLRLDDVFMALQENDFHYFPGKIDLAPQVADENGLRAIAIFWGALNLFGGGRSSQFLLENPEGFQRTRSGTRLPSGCYMNPLCRRIIQVMIDRIADKGYSGYFVDEPTPLRDCFCPSCRRRYEEWCGEDLLRAEAGKLSDFRERCVVDYVHHIARYCKENHPHLETLCCLMPQDEGMWARIASVPFLDNFGSDLYWVNNDDDVENMAPTLRAMAALCRTSRKIHHEWLQCWDVRQGREDRILAQGEILIREKPDALYVWAWKGQAGTSESCADPVLSWENAKTILRKAKEDQ
jgi:hypothetical protein